MPDLATNVLLSVAVFAGAFVSGLAGFAFSAVAGAILLRIFQPLEAVPLMMACSIGVQAANLWALRRNIQWEGSLLLIVGGALGIPIAVYLLQNADTYILRASFGVVVALYAGYMLFRPALARQRHRQPAPYRAGRIWRRADRRIDRYARRASNRLVRHAWHVEKPAARPRSAVHRGHAALRTLPDAFAARSVIEGSV